MNTLPKKKKQVKRLSLKSVGFANTSTGGWPARPQVAGRLEGRLCGPAWPVDTACYLKLKHIYAPLSLGM